MTLLHQGIGYESLRLDGPIHPQRLNELTITRKINEHGYMVISGILPEEQGAEAIHRTFEGEPVVLRQLNTEGHSVQRLFHGVITRFTIHCVRSIYTFELEAISQSGQMDIERKRRSFQEIEQTYDDLVTSLVREYTYGDAIDTVSNAAKLGNLVLQYDETDWQFLKRLASRFGSVLVPDTIAASPKIFFGMPEGRRHVLGDDTFYRIRKTFGQVTPVYSSRIDAGATEYSAGMDHHFALITRISSEECQSTVLLNDSEKPAVSAARHLPGYISYYIDSLQYYALGDHLTMPASAGSAELVVVEAKSRLQDGLLQTSYELQRPEQIQFYRYENEQTTGVTLNGTVEEIAVDFVRVKLEIDEDYHRKHPKAAKSKQLIWFPVSTPYAAEKHTGWYDMPEKGEQVELYIPLPWEGSSYVTGTLRQQTVTINDPDTKVWSHPAGSQLQMDGQELLLSTSGSMTISLQPGSGIEISSPGNIGIQGGSIALNAAQTLSLEAAQAIHLKGGQSSMIVDGDTDIHSPTIHQVGTVKAPVFVADLAPVPEPPLMSIQAYQAGQAAAQQQKVQTRTATPKAKITPPVQKAKSDGLLGLLSKVAGAIPVKTTSKVLLGINNPLAKITGALMHVNASVPVRRSGGGSQGIVTAAASQVYHAAARASSNHHRMSWSQLGHIVADGFVDWAGHVDERDQHYRRWWAGKVLTQARIALLTPISPIGWTAQLNMEQSYRQIPADVRLRWENEKQRMALEAYNLQRHQEKEAEIAQQVAEEAERNNHSTAWIIWDEITKSSAEGIGLAVDIIEGRPEVLKERAKEFYDGLGAMVGMVANIDDTYEQISQASSGEKIRMVTDVGLSFLPLKAKLPKLPFDMPKLNPGMEMAGADGMVYRIAEKDLPSPEKNGYMRSEGTGKAPNMGSVVKDGNKTNYTNPAGNELTWFDQHPKNISRDIETFLNSPNIGKATEGKVAKFVSEQKEVTGFGQKVQRADKMPAGDFDVLTKDEIIEVKASAGALKVDQIEKYTKTNHKDFFNPENKRVIVYIEEPLVNLAPEQSQKLNKIKNMGAIVVNSLEELKGVLK
ncbi:contractile injection system protein, VgrG/Pvc8 family [Paenibacillus shenyangensis]|uniref:contractile injection system protein, VgrG/Pvc8 family n=1 Tax=Paenibacillus sp. A9 TaxID=1284352 RepID=UPI00036C47B6|nr:contractile injection system protein, VgrG/Pvc8 family [Paenibacillus sp. A9]